MPHTESPRGTARIAGALQALTVALAAVLLALAAPAQAAAHGPKRHVGAKHHATPEAAKPPPTHFAAPAATVAFGLNLLHAFGPTGNVVLSPDSVEAGLAMAGVGAGGTTATQMASALALTSPASFPSVGTLQSTIESEQAADSRHDAKSPTLQIANGLFVQQGLTLESPFQSTLSSAFGAVPQSVDFTMPAAAAQTINGFVSTATDGIIPQIVSPTDLAGSELALANAVYLNAQWESPFDAPATGPAPFAGASATVSTPFMHQSAIFSYAHGPGYALVQLPYQQSSLSLDVLLPVGQTVDALQAGLTAPKLAQMFAGLASANVVLSLPRFHLGVQTSLDAALQALGMTDAFSPGADFSGITSPSTLSISDVEHAADFTVDETGTVAAAATAVSFAVSAEQLPEGPTYAFDANHPFLFFLRDDTTGTLLFIGRLSDPGPS